MVRLMSAVLCVLMLWSGASRADDPSATPYLLSPGDRVMISVWQEETLRQETTVLPDGSITFPLAGRVNVAGLDPTAAAQKISAGLKAYLAEPNVSVVVTGTAGNLVYVQGKVIKPGPVPMAGPTAVLQALSMSGGLDKFADESAIKVIRGTGATQKVLPVRYKDLVSGRDLSTNFQLQAGDTLVVP
ncbi:polysaccharide biosynthesis/export family protein [Pseudomonas sichuanensis]|uniref:polysaccharide biosynthesis/export family protein n=1 Tax=Pseudomonas TaxID=286 RepID=UPI00129B0EB7|nr:MULTISPECIES: polysaccharide biosynthesis/export family protein [Pseudomonas]MDH0732673.1 polysaccharide biosynthesis/export family protein [Pseudomonas sichuanensis]MDH1584592.1 polysaccharide biosynthesis/export family protein [Pseudomonas sichuanensis]MDH1593068.1 polysaccharide biosynthesis/export family protein [Pseudomonas sichuanensis]MDH1600085.1 polysaccharide biosynthesis/export family protein [Pseudomonas sichuanensis]MDU9404370.1 polysaccharide biosynthesis/export family protein